MVANYWLYGQFCTHSLFCVSNVKILSKGFKVYSVLNFTLSSMKTILNISLLFSLLFPTVLVAQLAKPIQDPVIETPQFTVYIATTGADTLCGIVYIP